jgi:hypothetical protein
MILGACARPGCPVVPFGTEEVHLHIVRDGVEALEAALQDLAALVVRYEPRLSLERRAA